MNLKVWYEAVAADGGECGGLVKVQAPDTPDRVDPDQIAAALTGYLSGEGETLTRVTKWYPAAWSTADFVDYQRAVAAGETQPDRWVFVAPEVRV